MATYSWGMDPAKYKLVTKHVPYASMSFRYLSPLPAAQRIAKGTSVSYQSLKYGFRFFFPSGGKVPGSPIPTSGQVAPRPV